MPGGGGVEKNGSNGNEMVFEAVIFLRCDNLRQTLGTLRVRPEPWLADWLAGLYPRGRGLGRGIDGASRRME